MKRRAFSGAWLLAAAAAGAQPACPPAPTGAVQLSGDGLLASWRADPAPIAVGRPFALLVSLCPAQARLLRVDATMPDHRHGMNYRPSVQDLGDGRWRVEGLLWHMSGRWELRLDLSLRDQTQVLRHDVTLP